MFCITVCEEYYNLFSPKEGQKGRTLVMWWWRLMRLATWDEWLRDGGAHIGRVVVASSCGRGA